jgi:hypothetical protein
MWLLAVFMCPAMWFSKNPHCTLTSVGEVETTLFDILSDDPLANTSAINSPGHAIKVTPDIKVSDLGPAITLPDVDVDAGKRRDVDNAQKPAITKPPR